ncbi:MAG TPA: T9SS type A sorting domain-containing protein [Bacteroidota bacterium]|nr:T9SS type A sorting domain-containing protein [Bacteroidota bacterium]
MCKSETPRPVRMIDAVCGWHRRAVRLFVLLILPVLGVIHQSGSAVIQRGAAFRLEGTYSFSATGAIGDSIRWRLDRQLVDEATGTIEQAGAIDSASGATAMFSLPNFPGKRTEYVIRAVDAAGEDSCRIRVFAGGVVSTVVYSGPNNVDKPVRAFLVVPPQVSNSSRIVAVMHGVDRNAQTYIVPWIGFAPLRNRIVIAPEFTSALWPSSRSYNLGNMFTKSDTTGSAVPEPQWSFSILQEIVESIRAGFLLDDSLYDIWGHSAGAQFVHRMVLAKPMARIRVAVAANAGSYTFTDTTIAWPFGVRYSLLGMRTAELQAFTQRPLVVMRGTADTIRDANLDTSPEADAQGLTRYARAGNFLARAKVLNPNTVWGFFDVPGVGHDQAAMSSSAQELLGGDWPPPARTTLTSESFGTTAVLPPGWTSSGAGWSASTSNASIRYVGASGGTNMNASNSGTETTTLTFLSGLSVSPGTAIAARWGARRSTSFTNPMTFEFSPDGVSWQQVTYAEVPNTTTWMWVNNSDEIVIPLPPGGATALAFRWTFTQANNGGAYRIDDLEIAGTTITDVNASYEGHPAGGGLQPNYPNPFNPTTCIPFRIERRGNVGVDVFDILGRHVTNLVNGVLEAGEHEIRVNMSGRASGTYVVRLATEGHVSTIRMVFLR